MTSEAKPSEPISAPSNVIDLSAIAERNPVNQKTMVLDLSGFDASKLTLIEVLDMAEIAGVAPEKLASLLGGSSLDPRKARMLYALGWVIARRESPSLTFAEVSRWRMDVKGTMDEKAMEASRAKARALVNAAIMAGVSPEEAERLTMGQLEAYKDRSNRAARRGPRRGRKR